MITNRFHSTKDGGTTWSVAPQWVTSANGRERVVDMAARGEFTELIASDPPTYREWREQGTAWLEYDDPVLQDNPEPEDDIPVAAVYLAGTAQERAQAQREDIRGRIESNRLAADVLQIDLRADPGRIVLMDEANTQGEEKLNALAAALDEDLDAFDPAFDPQQIGSVATARSLFAQTERVLSTDPTLDAQQIADLQALQSQYSQIVLDGDDAAAVPAPTDNVRLKLGVVAEGFGTIQVRRFYEAGFWWLEFELRTDRELSVPDYWVAVYDGTGTYLTTPQLTEVAPNRYLADKGAVNLSRPTRQAFQYTLCHQHISNPQFDRLVLADDLNERIDPIRWGGSAS